MRASSVSTTCLPPSVKRVVRSATRVVEALLELREPLIERAGELAGAAVDALVEGVDVIAHRLGDVLGALAQPLDQFAAIGLHGAVELGDVAGDQAAERRGVARNLLGERGAAVVEHVLEGLQARAQHVLDRVAAAVERTSASASALSRKVSATALLRATMVSVMRAPVCSSLETTSPPRRLKSSTSESPVERSVRVHLLGAGGDGFGHAAAGLR